MRASSSFWFATDFTFEGIKGRTAFDKLSTSFGP